MPRVNNPVLGVIQCDSCERQATVHQASKGRGRFLYTRCTECGADQRNGQAVQKRLWNKTEWRPGLKPEIPPKGVEPPKDWEPGQPPPASKAEPVEPESEPVKPKKSTGGGRVATGAVGVAMLGVTGAVVWLKARTMTR